jgi:hypothetical protein
VTFFQEKLFSLVVTIYKFIINYYFLESRIKSKRITYHWHDQRVSLLEAAISRGDRRIGQVIYEAFLAGCKFDGWGEHFKYNVWLAAFEKCRLEPEFYTSRHRRFLSGHEYPHTVNFSIPFSPL